MKGRGRSKSDVEAIAKVLPKTGGEAAVHVGDDGAGEAVVIHDVLKELVSRILCGSFFEGGDEVSHFGGAVCDGEDLVVGDAIA